MQPPPPTEPLAPELDGGLGWLNTPGPTPLNGLTGQLVILHFWTASSISSRHTWRTLSGLQSRRAVDPLVVIGVHSGKFSAEQGVAAVGRAIERLGVQQPVYVDREMLIWEKYNIASWPSLVFVRPNGNVSAVAAGEPDPAVLDKYVDTLLAEARADGTLKAPIERTAPTASSRRPLSFPTDVLSTPDGRVFVSDSGHGRVLALDASGAVTNIIGGLVDPRGLALFGGDLLIADPGVHSVFRVAKGSTNLERVAGTGTLGIEALGDSSDAPSTSLRSPWGIAVRGEQVFVSLAGSNQIALLDLAQETIRRFSGSGRHSLTNGSADRCGFAQPTGLSIDGDTLYVVDSDASAIRKVSLANGATSVLLGRGAFDFGDKDGPIREARLQFPLSIAHTSAGLVVADSYNGKLKLAASDSTVSSVVLSVDGIGLQEPGGLAVASDGLLLVADTGNHRILTVPVGDGRLQAEAARPLPVRLPA